MVLAVYARFDCAAWSHACRTGTAVAGERQDGRAIAVIGAAYDARTLSAGRCCGVETAWRRPVPEEAARTTSCETVSKAARCSARTAGRAVPAIACSTRNQSAAAKGIRGKVAVFTSGSMAT